MKVPVLNNTYDSAKEHLLICPSVRPFTSGNNGMSMTVKQTITSKTCKGLSSGMLRHVVSYKLTDVAKAITASSL
jgi:hypothetical protein